MESITSITREKNILFKEMDLSQRKLPLSSAILAVAQSMDGEVTPRKAPVTTPSKLLVPKP